MEQKFNFKELYQVALKATYPIEADGKTIEAGETIAVFDRISVAILQEQKDLRIARGGMGNAAQVIWETTKEVNFAFSQGVFSNIQFALMGNAKLLKLKDDLVPIHQIEEKETSLEGDIEFTYTPIGKVYIYNKETGERITDFIVSEENEKVYNLGEDFPFKMVVLDYNYNYDNGGSHIVIGRRLTEGFLELQGRTRVQDDNTGDIRTGIIKIPKIKLMSELSIKLGRDVGPIVANFLATAYPVGGRGNQTVMEMFFLEDNIDSDI